MKEESVGFCIDMERSDIPLSNIKRLTLNIESIYLPDEFVYDVGKLIVKYHKKLKNNISRTSSE